MASTKLVTVASRVPMAIRMRQVEPNPAEPGKTGHLAEVIIHGSGDDGTTEGFTRNVDEAIFDTWMAENANHPAVVSGLFRKVPDDEKADPVVYGFEPPLATAPDAGGKSADDEKKLKAKS